MSMYLLIQVSEKYSTLRMMSTLTKLARQMKDAQYAEQV